MTIESPRNIEGRAIRKNIDSSMVYSEIVSLKTIKFDVNFELVQDK